MAQLSFRKILKFLPALCIIFLCVRILRQDKNLQATSLIRKLHYLKTRQHASLSSAADKSVSSLKDKQNATLRKSVDSHRLWFDNRILTRWSIVKHKVSEHPIFQGYSIENKNLCGMENVDILVYLHSAPQNKKQRHAIRTTWASTKTFIDIKVKLLFILGISDDLQQQFRIESEASTYGDIVQGRFFDSFGNLTHKAVTMMAWVSSNCPQARFIVKADDDMFVDMFRVVTDLIPNMFKENVSIMCDVKENMAIVRSAGSKWNVPEKVLTGVTNWPRFCPGYFLVMTGTLIPYIFEQSFYVYDFIPIDDAYLFGVLTVKIDELKYINIHGQISPQIRADPIQELNSNGKFEYIAFREGNAEKQFSYWHHRFSKLNSWETEHSAVRAVLNESNETLQFQ